MPRVWRKLSPSKVTPISSLLGRSGGALLKFAVQRYDTFIAVFAHPHKILFIFFKILFGIPLIVSEILNDNRDNDNRDIVILSIVMIVIKKNQIEIGSEE